MHKGFLQWAAVSGALAVGSGAFGAHGLKALVPPETINTFETGVRYQFYHTFALCIVAILYERYSHKWLRYAATCFLLGILLFSGSLYLLTVFKASEAMGFEKIGIVTPVGGLFFVFGWLLLLVAVSKKS